MMTTTVTSLVATITLAALAVGSGTAAAAAGGASTAEGADRPAMYEPSDRGTGDRDRGDRGRGQAEPPAEEEAQTPEQPSDPCPTEQWTIPIEIRGLLCALILEKRQEDKPAPEEPAPAPAPARAPARR